MSIFSGIFPHKILGHRIKILKRVQDETLKQVQGDVRTDELCLYSHAELVSASNVSTEKILKQVQGDPETSSG